MNTFKREFLLFQRGRLYYTVIPLLALLFSIWTIYGLKVLEFNYIDIVQIYSILPVLTGIVVPLLIYNIWSREVTLGIDSVIRLYNRSIRRHIYIKLGFYILFFSILLLSIYLIVALLLNVAELDLNHIFTINLGTLVTLFLYMGVALLLSTIIRHRVLYYICGTVTMLLLQLFPLNSEFLKGVIDWGQLLFLLSGTVFLVECSIYLIGREFNTFVMLSSTALLILSFFVGFQTDLTERGRYTLTSYSKSYIEGLDDNITLDLYLAEESRDVSSLVKQLHSLESITGSIIYGDSALYRDAVRLYEPLSTDGENYNFIVIQLGQDMIVIPHLIHFDTLEFEILRVLTFLNTGYQKRVGVYIGNSDFKEENFISFRGLLSEHVESDILFPGDPIPTDLYALIVVGHFDINNYYSNEVWSYLESGGNILFALNGVDTRRNLLSRKTPILNKLEELGVVILPYLIGDYRSVGLQESDGTIKEYPLNLQTFPNRDLVENPIVTPFTGLTALHSSPVITDNRNFSTLLYSSKEAWLVDSTTGMDGTPESQYPIAIGGELDSGSRVVVIGNNLGLTEYNSNQDFFLRSVYYLIGDEELLSVRHKYNWDRSMSKIETSLYRGTLINVVRALILISPIWLLLLLAVLNKVLVLLWIRLKSN